MFKQRSVIVQHGVTWMSCGIQQTAKTEFKTYNRHPSHFFILSIGDATEMDEMSKISEEQSGSERQHILAT